MKWRKFQSLDQESHLKTLVTSFKVIIYQNMIKEAWRVSLFKLGLSITKSFLDLFLSFCAPVEQKTQRSQPRGTERGGNGFYYGKALPHLERSRSSSSSKEGGQIKMKIASRELALTDLAPWTSMSRMHLYINQITLTILSLNINEKSISIYAQESLGCETAPKWRFRAVIFHGKWTFSAHFPSLVVFGCQHGEMNGMGVQPTQFLKTLEFQFTQPRPWKRLHVFQERVGFYFHTIFMGNLNPSSDIGHKKPIVSNSILC